MVVEALASSTEISEYCFSMAFCSATMVVPSLMRKINKLETRNNYDKQSYRRFHEGYSVVDVHGIIGRQNRFRSPILWRQWFEIGFIIDQRTPIGG